MIYAMAIIISLFSCFIGFILEVKEGNVRHLKNGRKPEVGAAIVPAIPLVPLFYCGAVWIIDTQVQGFGLYVVSGYF